MPVMDGFTTIRNIRYSLRLDTPVIAVTGLSQHDEKQRCLNAGMNDYLSKPFKKEDLFRKLY
jgi:CheY-like chemotaxis protein